MKTQKTIAALVLSLGTLLTAGLSHADGRFVVGVPAPVAAAPGYGPAPYPVQAQTNRVWQEGHWVRAGYGQVWVPGQWVMVAPAPAYAAPVMYQAHRHHHHWRDEHYGRPYEQRHGW